MSKYGKIFTETSGARSRTPQNVPIPGRENEMKMNNAGGFTFTVDVWGKVDRFLILGAESNTYYSARRDIVVDSAKSVMDAVKLDGPRLVRQIVDANSTVEREDGTIRPSRVFRKSPSIFALAIAKVYGDENTLRELHNAIRGRKVISTVAQMYEFLFVVQELTGDTIPFGSGFKRAVNEFIMGNGVRNAAYQFTKYRRRTNRSKVMTGRDLLRMSHPKPINKGFDVLLEYINNREKASSIEMGEWLAQIESVHVENNDMNLSPDEVDGIEYLLAFEEVQRTDNHKRVVELIHRYGLTWEMVPNEWRQDRFEAERYDIWRALLGLSTEYSDPVKREDGSSRYRMPIGALIRNLPALGAYGVLKPVGDSNVTDVIAKRLTSESELVRGRIHPLMMLQAKIGYNSGQNRNLAWKPNARIVAALEDGFYTSFGSVEPTDKRLMISLDVSSSMTHGDIAGLQGLTPREASAVMAMVTMRRESDYMVTGFTDRLSPLSLDPSMNLESVTGYLSGLRFGRTDCSLPMQYAMDNNLEIDAFLVYTDNETWAGRIQPSQALEKYRKHSGINAKLIVVGMTVTDFTIADPKDPGMLDVVGFDTTAPQVISNFVTS